MLNKKYIPLLSLLFLIAGCKKDDVTLPIEPTITFVSISPAVVNQYSNPVIITIHYEDGDGDLGENKDGVKNCFVTDNRIGITYEFRIQQLAPTTASVAISGNLNIDIGGQALTDSSNQQSATFTLHLVDRAGHVSNSVTTSNVLINK
jgi:hypothetical protein